MGGAARRAGEVARFVAGVWVFFWSFPLATLAGWVRSFDVVRHRCDHLEWAQFMNYWFRVKVLRVPGSQAVYKGGPCMFLANHRSWCDFWMDVYLTEGRGMLISRMAVFLCFPIFMLQAWMGGIVLLIRRNKKGRDFEDFNAYVDAQCADSPLQGIIVYPEGTRNVKPQALPLRRGMLRYGYSRKLMFQVVITAGKERVLSQKLLAANSGETLVTGMGRPIDPNDFADFEAFFRAIQKAWDAEWERVYKYPKGSPDLGNLEAYELQEEPGYAYPAKQLAFMALIGVNSLVALLIVHWRIWAGVARAAGIRSTEVVVVVFLTAFLWFSVKNPKPAKALPRREGGAAEAAGAR